MKDQNQIYLNIGLIFALYHSIKELHGWSSFPLWLSQLWGCPILVFEHLGSWIITG